TPCCVSHLLLFALFAFHLSCFLASSLLATLTHRLVHRLLPHSLGARFAPRRCGHPCKCSIDMIVFSTNECAAPALAAPPLGAATLRRAASAARSRYARRRQD